MLHGAAQLGRHPREVNIGKPFERSGYFLSRLVEERTPAALDQRSGASLAPTTSVRNNASSAVSAASRTAWSPDAHCYLAPDDTRARLCSGSLTQDAALQQTMREAQQIGGLPGEQLQLQFADRLLMFARLYFAAIEGNLNLTLSFWITQRSRAKSVLNSGWTCSASAAGSSLAARPPAGAQAPGLSSGILYSGRWCRPPTTRPAIFSVISRP